MGLKTKKFKNWIISYLNEAELDEMLKELYEKKYYDWQSSKSDPVIFDVGALIGETVLYFKELYPKARITAFEPSPRSFKLLERNVSQNHLSNVRLINVAVAKNNGKMNFYISKSENNPWGRGDSLKENRFNNKKKSKVIKVSTVKLSDYIKEKIDLLKLDIEGAETEVIQEIEPRLKHVKQIILEFHASVYNPENSLPKIMEILKKHGFKTKIYLSRWLLPNFAASSILIFLSILKIDEYWLRIYAKH
ncbi:MAG: FkbM family methyltransferase [Patescibacteria group bacterium]